MDNDFLEELVSSDPALTCECGAEKNPDFPTCFICSKREQHELDDWIDDVQHHTQKWPQEPF